ncbi:MAG: DinB family protein [Daejeonella sp.]|nr:DinB family protein [Daejeonella sp.]
MNHHTVIQELSSNRGTFKTLLQGLNPEQFLWKTTPEKWCLLEIVCHLNDEETEDFRARTKHALDNIQAELSPIDPQGWVLQRNYMQQSYTQVLNRFLYKRVESVGWLSSLENPEWKNTVNHHEVGVMTAEMFLANWLAHDYLHIRQILKLKYDYLNQSLDGTLAYAGDLWL